MSHIHSVVYRIVGYASCITISSYRVGNDAICGGIYYRDSIRTAIYHKHCAMYRIVGYTERIKTYWYITNNAVGGSVYYCDSTEVFQREEHSPHPMYNQSDQCLSCTLSYVTDRRLLAVAVCLPV